jgi:hypothetical protein
MMIHTVSLKREKKKRMVYMLSRHMAACLNEPKKKKKKQNKTKPQREAYITAIWAKQEMKKKKESGPSS